MSNLKPFLSLDADLKQSETDTHVFFLNGPFSQWYPSDFRASFFRIDIEVFDFNCAEQFMMASKAFLFHDEKMLERILSVEQDAKDWRAAPKLCKELGREVVGFDPHKWDTHARDIVYEGNLAKFSQAPDLEAFMMLTGDKILVEGAHYDPVWGVKLAWNDPKITDPANWRGKNWLGEALMRVRATLRQ
jgi:ribA/ribD-fused uncharacterized protein